jgi:hypothetical protein
MLASDPASDFTATSTGKSPFALWHFYLLRAGYLLTASRSEMSRFMNANDPILETTIPAQN